CRTGARYRSRSGRLRHGQGHERLIDFDYNASADPRALPNGWFYPPDIAAYRDICKTLVPQGGKIAEIGTYRGRSLMSIAEILREKQIKVIAVDTFFTAYK